ncbi:MAG: hypothetical protein HY420_02920 [Candidatus Kerfeldbacteria bacterium]|nr:hypothetical protein [Candidatus Kerfeldbacteria bacterium]
MAIAGHREKRRFNSLLFIKTINMERKIRENRESEQATVLQAIKMVLANSPEAFGDRLEDIQSAVEGAEEEIRDQGKLSEGTAEKLDNLYRPFKPEFLK